MNALNLFVPCAAGVEAYLAAEVATITGGKHFHADTASDLVEIFREIARTLPVLVTE